MKSIDINKKQKEMLLEMCKILFPKDKVDYIEKGVIYFLINYFERPDPNNSKITFGGWDKTESIHWFEFCMTYLFTKIKIEPTCYENIEDYIHMNSSFIFGHPIDYLYEEFKKLK